MFMIGEVRRTFLGVQGGLGCAGLTLFIRDQMGWQPNNETCPWPRMTCGGCCSQAGCFGPICIEGYSPILFTDRNVRRGLKNVLQKNIVIPYLPNEFRKFHVVFFNY